MTDLTMGQRIAECRKQLGLSQEALGEKMGVSRQAISKWEADGAVPEIDKLITLSKLFGVSVGWLLGVEEMAAPTEPQAEISEELLHKIEQIVLHYQPRKEKLSTGKKICISICAVLLLLGGWTFFREWDITRDEVGYVSAQIRNNNEQNANILNQLTALENRINNMSVVPDAAVTEAIISSYRLDTELDRENDKAEVSTSVIPSTWHEDIAAFISVRKEGTQVTIQRCSWDGSAWISKILLPVDDGYEYWLVLEHPDGTKEQTVLSDYSAENLAETYTIGCKITYGTANFDLIRQEMVLSGYEFHITNPTLNQYEGIPWQRAELVLTHIRGYDRSVADTYTLFKPLEANESMEDGVSSAWSSITCYPNGPFRLPEMEEGDGLELWVILEMGGGLSNNKLITSWSYHDGEFQGGEPMVETVPVE